MKTKYIIGIVVILMLLLQLFSSNPGNPQVTADLKTDQAVKKILKNSCYDCHSNETNFPWYSKIAPVSFLISNHIKEGRKHLNFSDWEKLDSAQQSKLSEEIIEEIEKGGMPLSSYKFIHPSAELTDSDVKILKTWFGNDK